MHKSRNLCLYFLPGLRTSTTPQPTDGLCKNACNKMCSFVANCVFILEVIVSEL